MLNNTTHPSRSPSTQHSTARITNIKQKTQQAKYIKQASITHDVYHTLQSDYTN